MSDATDLADCSAHELLALYRSRKASPVEATRAALARIERLNPVLNAFCVVAAEDALRSAAESEARWARSEPAGDLDRPAVHEVLKQMRQPAPRLGQ